MLGFFYQKLLTKIVKQIFECGLTTEETLDVERIAKKKQENITKIGPVCIIASKTRMIFLVTWSVPLLRPMILS